MASVRFGFVLRRFILADRLGVSNAFLDEDLFLFLFFASNNVGALVLNGVSRPFIGATSLTTTSEPTVCNSPPSSLLAMCFSDFEDLCTIGFVAGEQMVLLQKLVCCLPPFYFVNFPFYFQALKIVKLRLMTLKLGFIAELRM